ncbi:MAG: hypothetical protein HC888_17115 [Candidatus Competibacteraceae bacterium]|nr:hypothetical protein [Candidatus Competibacteraceae bacterium]
MRVSVSAADMVRLRPYTVGVYPEYTLRGAEPKEQLMPYVSPIYVTHSFRHNRDAMPGLYVLHSPELYDPVFGLTEPGAGSMLNA